MKYKKHIVIITAACVLILCGCTIQNSDIFQYSSTTETTSLASINPKLEKTIDDTLMSRLEADRLKIKELNIHHINHYDNDTMLQFTFLVDSNKFEGVAYLKYIQNKYIINDIEYSILSSKNKISYRLYRGSFTGAGLTKKVTMVSGIINENSINEIRVFYNNGQISLLKIGQNQSTFFDVNLTDNRGISKIEAYNSNNKLI